MAKSQTKASNKYNAKAYDRIALQVYKGSREIIQAAASNANESTNAYIVEAIDRRMKSEGLAGIPTKTVPDSSEAPKKSETSSLNLITDESNIEDLELSVRAYNFAKRAGCNTVRELKRYLVSDRCIIDDCGKTYREIKEKLENCCTKG